MFNKITTKIIKTVSDKAKAEVSNNISNILPSIVGAITMGIIILSMIDTDKKEKTEASNITINNYYINIEK